MSGIRELLEGLEDPYPLRMQVREARDALARRRSILALRQFHGGTAPDPGLAPERKALQKAEAAAEALDGGWEEFEQAVAEAEAAHGVEPEEPGPQVLAEVQLLATGASVLHDGYAPRSAVRPAEPGSAAGRTALAVGAGIAMVALGAPHFAIHAAMAAGHAHDKKPKGVKRPPPPKSAGRALERLRAGLPAGEASADGVREALDALARAPRDGSRWNGFLDAAQERLGVLRRAHLRARAKALLEQER